MNTDQEMRKRGRNDLEKANREVREPKANRRLRYGPRLGVGIT
jgi:hypothetical protein